MGRKQELVRIVVGPCGSENHDWFLRFGRFLFASAFPVNFGYTGMKLRSDLEEMKKHEEEQRLEEDLIIFGGA